VNSREAILTALRSAAPPVASLPDAPAAITYADPVKQFAEALAAVGGKAICVETGGEIDAALQKIDAYVEAKNIATLVPGVRRANIDLESVQDPHDLEGVDIAVLEGDLAVAENAAVWVDGSCLGPHRAIFVIAQHLVLVVPADRVVHNMQEAYNRIRVCDAGFGVFISGPSKTADIEQSLVIGAHGARSCTVLLTNPGPGAL